MLRLICAPLLALACAAAPVLPRPVSEVPRDGVLVLAGTVPIAAPPGAQDLARGLAAGLKAAAGLTCTVDGQGAPAVRLVLDPAVPHEEGYVLDIGRDVEVRARTQAGLYYGAQTLQQLAFHGLKGGRCELARLRIEDFPRYRWRGMHLDVSRHFFPKETIKAFLDVMALHKLNVFHWHLTDDHGWRLEIKRYPKLTAFSAWREPKDADHVMYDKNRSLDPARRTYGGFYTQDDVREVLAYAKDRHILVVPEIEMPAHSMAVLDAYPELSCTGRPYVPPADLNADTEFTDPFCAGDERTFEFLGNVLKEVVALFPSPYIHVGGDEARKAPWLACPKCRARMAKEGLKDAPALQSWFMRRIEAQLAGLGRKMIGWDEVLEGGLPATTTVMVWRDWLGDAPLAQSVAQGHETIATPASPLYFSLLGGPAKGGEDPAVAGLKAIYAFEPAPARLGPKARDLIIGGEACIWTEHIHSGKEALQVLAPNLCPLAEVLWSGSGGRDWEDFARRLDAHFPYLDVLKVDYRIVPPLAQGACGNVGSREGGYQLTWPSREGNKD